MPGPSEKADQAQDRNETPRPARPRAVTIPMHRHSLTVEDGPSPFGHASSNPALCNPDAGTPQEAGISARSALDRSERPTSRGARPRLSTRPKARAQDSGRRRGASGGFSVGPPRWPLPGSSSTRACQSCLSWPNDRSGTLPVSASFESGGGGGAGLAGFGGTGGGAGAWALCRSGRTAPAAPGPPP